jgi:dihydropteroate synthase
MGVLNVTPDSFSDGGRFLDPGAANAHGDRLIQAGADVIDVGGESTRPGAAEVPIEEERRRVLPVIEALSERVRVSVDTRKAEVARDAAAAGASMINDVSASLHEVAAEAGVAWVAMHMQGRPTTMQEAPQYDDVVAEVADHLEAAADRAESAGVEEVWIDPGIGFGKALDHNLALLAHLDRFVATGRPVVVGTSRKSLLGTLLAESDGADEAVPVDDRLDGSLATATWAMAQGVAMVRVHDVAPHVQAARVVGPDRPESEDQG